MKLRIQGNAIRYRLNRREVEEFARSGRVEAAVEFPTGPLRYTLESDSRVCAPEAVYEPGRILIRVPADAGREWAAGDEVALRGPSGGGLEILVEKDFQCLHKGEEGRDPDAYPNPGR